MALAHRFLLDTSAASRIEKPAVASKLLPLMAAGLVMRCTVTDLEAGFSATGKAHYRLASRQRALWPLVVISQSVLDRAYEVQGLLAERSQHRVVKIPDLMIAAAAEASGLVVLHYDRDFDRIARITGQPTRWVVKAGTADGE